jgi:hypothetical protein
MPRNYKSALNEIAANFINGRSYGIDALPGSTPIATVTRFQVSVFFARGFKL